MAEPSDPEVLHARVSILEKDNDRHENDISKLWEKVTTLEVCAAALPKIEKALDSISAKVDALTSCSAKDEGKRVAFLSVREWAIVAIALAGILLDHFVIH